MKVRNKNNKIEGVSGSFNIHSINEIIIYSNEDCWTDFARDYEVQLKDGSWINFYKGIKNHDIITDNYNTSFFEPRNEDDRKRGYTL